MSKSDKENAPPRRCYLFHAEEPAGQIFVGEQAIVAALKAGWSDTRVPAQVAQPATAGAAVSGSADRIVVLETALDEAAEQVTELTKALEANGKELAAANSRVTAAEKKLQAAEKKLAANASK